MTSAADDAAEALYRKAEFCITTGVQPSEYDQMTDDEINAFIDVINERAN